MLDSRGGGSRGANRTARDTEGISDGIGSQMAKSPSQSFMTKESMRAATPGKLGREAASKERIS